MNARPHQSHLVALVRALRENGRLLAILAGRCDAIALAPPSRGATFRRPADIAAYLGPEMAQLPQEQLRVVLLDRRNWLIDAPLVYQGGQAETTVRLAECFRDAVRCAAAALVFVHCHPSGDPTPSPDDVRLTREAGEASALLGIDVLDHAVVADDGFVSLREAGLYIPPATFSDNNVPAASASSGRVPAEKLR
jgi:DNA repair protein RadC